MANCNYKVNIKDIQSKYSFKIFCSSDNAEIQAEIGNLEDLTTTAKNNLVSAINEVHSDTETNATAISGLQSSKEDKSNKVTTLSSMSTDTQYPSAKAVYDSQETQDETISTLETNLEETQAELDYYKTIYNVLPKVEGNGESITLDNTAESILKLDLKGQCKQDSTTGKNLASLKTSETKIIGGVPFTIENGIIKLSGTTTVTSDRSFYFDKFQANSGSAMFWIDATGYTDKTSGNSSILLLQSDDGSTNWTIAKELSLNSSSVHQSDITLDSSKYYRIQFYTYENTFTNATIKIQLEYGNEKTTFEPYTNGASPNPDYPQDVHVVSGDNTIEVVGKQLFQSAYLPTPTSAPNAVLKAGTYTIASCDNNNFGKNIYFRLLDMNNNLINESGHITSSNTNINFSTSSYFYLGGQSVSYITFTIDNDYKVGIGILESDNTKQVMLVSGSEVVRTYQPYQSQTYPINLGELELCKIGDYQDYFTKNSGKNLLNINNSETGGIDNSDTLIVNPYSWRTTEYIKVQPNTNYTFSNNTGLIMRLYEYDSSKTFISPRKEGSNGAKTFTITTGTTTEYLKWTIYNTNSITLTKAIVESYQLQIEKGNSPTYYEPFGKDMWCKYNAIGKEIFGNLYIRTWTSTYYGLYFYAAPNNILNGSVVLSDIYKQVSATLQTWVDYTMTIDGKNIQIKDSRYTSVSDYQEAVYNNSVYYQLETPYLSLVENETLQTQLDAIEKALGKDGQTNISQVNNDAPFKIYASALMKISGE